MKNLTAVLMLATAIVTPSLAFAKDISISAHVAQHNGPNAYLAVYVTKADGTYVSTLAVAGSKQRYYREMRNWARGVAAAGGKIDGVTGASVGGGQTLNVNVQLADTLIDAGYQIRVDDAVEDGAVYSSDVVIPLTAANSGKPFTGQGYVDSLTVSM
jgi:hypothetical protein